MDKIDGPKQRVKDFPPIQISMLELADMIIDGSSIAVHQARMMGLSLEELDRMFLNSKANSSIIDTDSGET